MKFHYRCVDCNYEFESEKITYTCPHCNSEATSFFPKGYLEVIIDDSYLKKLSKKDKIYYKDFSPYVLPDYRVFPVGNTPLIRSERISELVSASEVYFKMDSLLPSGSFKDRASQLIVAQAIHFKQKDIVLASTGNAGASMSCAGASYGLNITLFIPKSAPENKLKQSILYGANVIPIDGNYDEAYLMSIKYSKEKGLLNRNTAFNPMTIEGKKSVSIELYNDFNKNLPDSIYVPVGDGCIISGVYKGFIDLLNAGLIEKVPEIICCQSEGSNAISKAFNDNKFENINANTVADSISVDSPACGRMAVKYLKQYGGRCITVSDKKILNAQRELCKMAGIFAEPASSTAYACLKEDSKALNKKVCVLITGIGFKDMSVF